MTNLTELLEHSAQRFPGREALRMFDRSLGYAEMVGEVERVAGGLRELGVRMGDRVAIYSENTPEYLISYLAVARLGAILATVNPLFREAEVSYILQNSEPRVVLVEPSLEPLLRHSIRATGCTPEHVVRLTGPADESAIAYDQLRRAQPVRDPAPTREEDGVVICYTSGSTARPKPVFRSHGGELFLAYSHAKIWHLGPDDRLLVTLPLSWLFGLTTCSMACLSGGGAVVLVPHFNPAVVLEELEKRRITVFAGVMTMYVKMLQVAEEPGRDYDLSSLRLCLHGGAPRNETVVDRFAARFGPTIHDIYATSECTPIFTYDPRREPRPRPGSCGRLVEGVEVRLLDPRGNQVAAGDVGELVARCPGMMLGYYREPELTAEVLRDGWCRTGDLLRADQDGYYYVVGRAKDFIIRGGANIAPAEVEAVIGQHPAVAEAAVLGVPDPIYGEQPMAYVIRRPGMAVSGEEIKGFCHRRLANYKVPTRIEFLDEFPKGPTGKVNKGALREQHVKSAAAGGSG